MTIDIIKLAKQARDAELLSGSGEPAYANCEIGTDMNGDVVRVDCYTADQLAAAVLRERERCVLELERNADKTLEEIIAAIKGQK